MARLGRALRRVDIEPVHFGYVAAFQEFDVISSRLRDRLAEVAEGDYIAIGHSLGGLLLRSAIAALPQEVRRPSHLWMLGTPHRSPRLAQRFQQHRWYRWLNGDVGQLLASPERISAIPSPAVPSTIIAGTGGPRGRWSLFGEDANDGIVALEEATNRSAGELIPLPVLHPWMMNDRRVRALLLARTGAPSAPVAEG
jgi:hypothetical protein